MKRFLGLVVLVGSASMCVYAADYTGYIVDKSCAKMKAMWTNTDCATKCIGRGDPAVFVTEDGKVYQVADQDKVKTLAGKKVAVTGKVSGDKITVDTIAAKAD